MDVAVSELRAALSTWLERARAGEEIVITDRGVPVARLLGMSSAPLLEQLIADGVVGRPASPRRPRATGRKRPRAARSVSDVISDQRR